MNSNDLVTIDPAILGGTPVFKGTRVPVKTLFEYMENDYSLEEFLECFPSVSRELACLVLERSDDYYRGRPKVDTIVIRIIGDPNTMYSNLVAGAVDIVTELTMPVDQGPISPVGIIAPHHRTNKCAACPFRLTALRFGIVVGSQLLTRARQMTPSSSQTIVCSGKPSVNSEGRASCAASCSRVASTICSTSA